MIKINKYNTYCQVEGLHNSDVISSLDKVLSYYVEGYMFSPAYKKGWWDPKTQSWQRWDGRKKLLDQYMRFPTGLTNYAEELFKKYNLEYTIEDKRKKIKLGKKIELQNYELRYYQEEAVRRALTTDRGIVKIATGGGKSVIIASLIARTNVSTMVYVPSLDLLYQTADVLEKALGIKIGRIGNGIIDIQKINICTIYTAAIALGGKYKPYDDEEKVKEKELKNQDKIALAHFIVNSDMMIVDECQVLATESLQLISNRSKNAFYKYGFSGTPVRDDGADMLLEAVCGSKIIDISASQLIKEKFLVQPKIHFVRIPEYHGALSKQYQSIYKEYIVENDVRNDKIVDVALKLFKAGRKTLILIKQIAHGQALLEKIEGECNVYFVKGDVEAEERERIKSSFINNEIDIIIASTIFDVGVDLPNLNALILAGSGKSTVRALQRIGRVIRTYPGKVDSIVVDFLDNADYLNKHSEKRLEIYKSEPEFKIILPSNGNDNAKTTKKESTNKTKESKSVQKSNRKPKVPW